MFKLWNRPSTSARTLMSPINDFLRGYKENGEALPAHPFKSIMTIEPRLAPLCLSRVMFFSGGLALPKGIVPEALRTRRSAGTGNDVRDSGRP